MKIRFTLRRLNKKMVESVERSRKEMREGELYDWAEFKKIVDEE